MTPDRDIGTVAALESLLPGWVGTIAIGITQLGSVAFLGAVVAGRLWLGDRREGAVGVAALLGAHALTVALKAVFGLPRPPPSTWLVEVGGLGFPSGHALTGTVVWGYLAATYRVGPRRRRLLVAGVLVSAIALSRVVLGVHYLVDVIAGIAIGICVLAGLLRWARRSPPRAFTAAGVIAGIAVAFDPGSETWLLLGAAIGGAVAVNSVGLPAREPGWRDVPVMIAAAVGLAGLVFVTYRSGTTGIAFVIGTLVGGLVLVLPAILDRIA